ncbi:hypothetical protein BXY70_1317 [Roseovarius halotolerans]|uniref:Uncharacterized protein n=1 Tax=Roseovarius halotolerans TaxID=505353 RepID=A0A1X6Y7H0_9RHOB|nr:hypothetical protein [Roseovarius halotolerans]RKT35284.1 hypothetical protein BXY70_1317 [Roseovarius halotolerans]SLN11247.1 hypothetical protein ROH8110_00079 [Roseovarius halotolerans]
MTLYVAVVPDTDTFDPVTHARFDLDVLQLTMSHRDNRLAQVSLEVSNPRTPLSSLIDARVFLSDADGLVFSGRFSYVPRGAVGDTVTLEAIAREDDIDGQIASLTESLKVAPFYDSLFVPIGAEDDPAEVLAGYPRTLAYSRTGGGVAAVDALSGATTLELKPLTDSIRYDVEPVAKSYGVNLTVAWRQLIKQTISDPSWTRDLSTMTPEGLISAWPTLGQVIGTGFRVSESSIAEELDAFDRPQREQVERIEAVSSDELDPAWIDAGEFRRIAEIAPMTASLAFTYSGEVSRVQTASFKLPAGLQDGATLDEEEIEDITLNDISRSDAPAWNPGTDYEEGDEVVDGGSLYRSRRDHTSLQERTPADWVLIGDAASIDSRRTFSFFSTARGQAALDHALERVRARARIASRCVRVSFEARMPDPHSVTEDCQVTLAHPKIPGGTITGRLVEYTLEWSGENRFTIRGTIAACPGNGGTDDASLDIDTSGAPSTGARASVQIKNKGPEQQAAFDAGTDIPETSIDIKTTPAPAVELEHEITVTPSGTIAIPDQATV